MPPSDLLEIAYRHTVAEENGDYEGTLATLEANPVYELFPVGLRMSGMDAARRYYRHFFDNVAPRFEREGMRVHGEWPGKTGVAIEYTVRYRYPEGHSRPFRILGILTYGETALTGERVYADEELLRIMFAPIWDEMEPITDA